MFHGKFVELIIRIIINLKLCPLCNNCDHCMDDPHGWDCQGSCYACTDPYACLGCNACVMGECSYYEDCEQCEACAVCIDDPYLAGCEYCDACAVCYRALGCWDYGEFYCTLLS